MENVSGIPSRKYENAGDVRPSDTLCPHGDGPMEVVPLQFSGGLKGGECALKAGSCVAKQRLARSVVKLWWSE
eukprot:364417-Chlamydomonas_euryale.AAC.2